MSGGANKGAYTAGVIHGLSKILNGTDAHYDVVSGVSAGALNAAGVAMWPKEKTKEMADWLVSFWGEVNQGMIFQMWPGGIEQGVLDESGVLDSTPMLNTLT
jgi:predicted acylesterase/phospholipase RssA